MLLMYSQEEILRKVFKICIFLIKLFLYHPQQSAGHLSLQKPQIITSKTLTRPSTLENQCKCIHWKDNSPQPVSSTSKES